MIDLLAGKNERRSVKLPSDFGESVYVLGPRARKLFPPDGARLADSCGAGLLGEPCLAYTLPDGVELITNFGRDTGMYDWMLSEVILGNRNTLLREGRIIGETSEMPMASSQ